MTNRRGFLGTLLSACVAVNLPTTWFPAEVRQKGAQTWLLAIFNLACKGKKLSEVPQNWYISKDLYEAYESELTPIFRFTNNEAHVDREPTLLFKSVRLHRSKSNESGWNVSYQV